MSKKKVLFFCYNFPPLGGGGVFRSVKFVKYLPQFDWNPIVVTTKKNAVGVKDSSLINEIPENVAVHRAGAVTPYFFFRVLKRIGLMPVRHYLDVHFCIPDKLTGWVPFALKKAKRIISNNQIDLIYTTSPPHSSHLIGLSLKKKYPQIPWVADFRDAWCANPFREVKETQIRNKIETKLEKKVFKRADALIFNTKSSLNLHRQKYGNIISNKSYVIPNGFDMEDYSGLPNYSKDNTFNIVHTGSIYGIRSLKPLVDALELFVTRHKKDQHKLKFIFIGYSINKDEKRVVATSKVNHLFEFRNFLSHSECLTEMKNADLLLVITAKEEVNVMIPCKFYEYLGSNSPILALSEKGELTKILQECNSGEWATLDNPEKICKLIYKFLANRKNKFSFQPNKEMIVQYERKNLTSQLVRIFNKLKKS